MGSYRPDLWTSKWKTLRLLILERDNWTCYLCGKKADQVDHLVPPSAGGTDSPQNLAAACLRCNDSKGNRYVDLPLHTVAW